MIHNPKRLAILQLLGFLTLACVAIGAVGPIAGLAAGLLGIVQHHPASRWLFPALVSAVLLGVTWAAFRAEGKQIRSLGLVPTRRRAVELGWGFVLAASAFAVVALVRSASIGASWTFDPVAGSRAAVLGLPLALVLLLPEELLFRGYAFRKAEALWGAPATLVVSALAFGAYHVVGSGYWGMGAVFRFAMPALGGLVFGYAALRTGGLALPIGLHLGGNWIQASVLGLGVERGSALWSASLGAEQIRSLSAPDMVPHLPYLLGLATLGGFVIWWPRKGSQSTV